MNRFPCAAMLALLASGTQVLSAPAAADDDNADVIAKVGDQEISFSQISTMLNSSAVVGLSVPALGSPERQQASIVLLDKIISANLLYLDAIRQGADQDPAYQKALRDFSDGVLASLSRKQYFSANLKISEDEIKAYMKQSDKPDAQLTADARAAIESMLRRQKLNEQAAA